MKRSPIKRSKAKPTHTTKDGRLILSPADWRKMKFKMWTESYGYPVCSICKEKIWDFCDFEPDHIIPRGMGGGTRDDRPENLQPSHRWCNRDKGSKRVQILDVT